MPPSNTDHLDAKLLDNIEHLRDDGSNWRVWKAQTLISLEHQEVLEFIDILNTWPISKVSPTVAKPESRLVSTTSNADTIVAWVLRSRRPDRIQSSLSNSIWFRICENKMWLRPVLVRRGFYLPSQPSFNIHDILGPMRKLYAKSVEHMNRPHEP